MIDDIVEISSLHDDDSSTQMLLDCDSSWGFFSFIYVLAFCKLLILLVILNRHLQLRYELSEFSIISECEQP